MKPAAHARVQPFMIRNATTTPVRVFPTVSACVSLRWRSHMSSDRSHRIFSPLRFHSAGLLRGQRNDPGTCVLRVPLAHPLTGRAANRDDEVGYMSVNQAPRPNEGAPSAPHAEKFLPGARQETNEPPLWGEELPWVDEVGAPEPSPVAPSPSHGTPAGVRSARPEELAPADPVPVSGPAVSGPSELRSEPASASVSQLTPAGPAPADDAQAAGIPRRRGRARTAMLTAATCVGIVVVATALISGRAGGDESGEAAATRSAVPYEETRTSAGAEGSATRSSTPHPARTGDHSSASPRQVPFQARARAPHRWRRRHRSTPHLPPPRPARDRPRRPAPLRLQRRSPTSSRPLGSSGRGSPCRTAKPPWP